MPAARSRKKPRAAEPEGSTRDAERDAPRRMNGPGKLHVNDDPDAPELTIEAGRFKRALELEAERGNVVKMRDDLFKVRSQRGGGSYVVERNAGLWLCDCADASPLRPCVHVLAVFLRTGILDHPDEEREETAAPEAGRFDWPAYNKAEQAMPAVLPRLAWRLFDMLPQPPPRLGPGRPSIPQTDSLLCALMWATNQKNMRREQETRDRLHADGLLSRRVACNDVSRTLTDERTTALLVEALARTREPFAAVDSDASPLTLAVLGDTFAVDSTGFTPSRRGHYNHEKHGPDKPIPWLKCHLMVSTKARLIAGATITASTGKGTGDTSQFAPLLEQTAEAFPVGVVVGDGAYANRQNVALVRELGARPLFPPRDDANMHQRGSPGWADMVAFFRVQRPAFDALYHRRSIVEAVNSAIKRRFGETLRSRTATGRTNELLCKLVAYNLCVLVQNLHYLHAEEEWLDRIL